MLLFYVMVNWIHLKCISHFYLHTHRVRENNLHALRNRHEQCKMSQFSLSMRNQIKMPILLIHTHTYTHIYTHCPWHTAHCSAIVVMLFWPGYQHPQPQAHPHRRQPHLRPVNSCFIVLVAYLLHNTLIFEFILLVPLSSSCRFSIYMVPTFIHIVYSSCLCTPIPFVCLN